MGCFLKGSLASIGACVAKTVDVGMEGFLAPFLSLVCDLGTRLHLSSFLRDHGVLLQYMLLGQTTVLPSNSPSTPPRVIMMSDLSSYVACKCPLHHVTQNEIRRYADESSTVRKTSKARGTADDFHDNHLISPTSTATI
ncbi:hypothetical protein AB1N83_009541 [Pleurotus pulmonarius]